MNCDGILIIEDDKALQTVLGEILKLGGYRVRIAGDGKEALENLRARPVPPCLMIIDLMMPVMNGWDFIAACEADEVLSKVPRVVMSAMGERMNEVKAQAYIKKPADMQSFLDTVTKHIHMSS